MRKHNPEVKAVRFLLRSRFVFCFVCRFFKFLGTENVMDSWKVVKIWTFGI